MVLGHANYCVYKIRDYVFCVWIIVNFFRQWYHQLFDIYDLKLVKVPFELYIMGTDGDQAHLFIGDESKYPSSRAIQILKSIIKQSL